MTQYIIVDGFGTQLGGISTSEAEIKRIAQSTANDLGRPVWYQGDDYEVDHRGDPIDGSGTSVEVEPESYADADEALAEIEAEEQAAHDDDEERIRDFIAAYDGMHTRAQVKDWYAPIAWNNMPHDLRDACTDARADLRNAVATAFDRNPSAVEVEIEAGEVVGLVFEDEE